MAYDNYNNKFKKQTILLFEFIIVLSSILTILSITSCALLSNNFSLKPIDFQISTKTSNPQIELFVMSQCLYAIEAEKTIIPMIKELKDKVNFNLYFIARENNEDIQGEFSQSPPEMVKEIEEEAMDQCHGEFISEGGKFLSLHGKSEIEEDIRQVVMATYYPDKFLDYLLLRSENFSSDNWEECATRAWMDCKFINQIAQSEEGEALFKQNIKKAHELKISASPTLLINKKRYRGHINRFGLGRKICKEGPANEFCASIPACGSDSDCLAEGKVGVCVDPDKPKATCKFSDPVPFKLTVIYPVNCPACSPSMSIQIIKDLFPEVQIEELKNDSLAAEKLINDFNIKELPAFFFDKGIAQTARYIRIKDRLLKAGDGFLLNPKYINITYLLDREEKGGDAKLFIESMSSKGIETEDFLIKEGLFRNANIAIHYLAGRASTEGKKEVEVLTIKRDRDNPGILHLRPQENKVVFKSPKGLKEIREDIRQICIGKYYPEQHMDYLSCINKELGKDEENVDWRQCLMDQRVDYQKIESCINGREGMNLLLKDIALVEELEISFCPTYLINNNVLLRRIDPISFKRIYAELTQKRE